MSRYWHYLLGAVLWPPSVFAAEVFQLHSKLAEFVTFGLALAAFLPVFYLLMTRQVRHSFWLVTIGVVFGSWTLASLAYRVIHSALM